MCPTGWSPLAPRLWPRSPALARARQPAADNPVRHLTIAIPAAPGQQPLTGVEAELEVLDRHFPAGADNHRLAGPQATREAALKEIGTHSWVHSARTTPRTR